MRISHSQKETYLTCGFKWKMHYQERLRSTKIGSALFFGSAVDNALNRLLLAKKKELTQEEKDSLSKTAVETFEESFRVVDINGKSHDISSSILVTYFTSDFGYDLLKESDIEDIVNFAGFVDIDFFDEDDLIDFGEYCRQVFRDKKELSENEQRLFNYMCWKSLVRKGTMLIDEYEQIIMPKIEEVFDIQTKVDLKDGDDQFIGYVDFIGSFTDEPGVKYIIDNKTSSRPYKEDSVRTSPQLAAYCEYAQIDKAAFIVMEKKIRKRNPKIRINIIRDDMPEQQILDTFTQVTEVIESINEKKFDKNYDSCYAYGRKCAYFDYCRTGKIDKGLIRIPERKENGSKINSINKSSTNGTSKQIENTTEGNPSGEKENL